MRNIRYSRTFYDEFAALLEQGIDRFGASVVAEKRDKVFRVIETFLAVHPVRPVDPDIGLCAYPVTGTPFVLVYDYDDDELRLHMIIHGHADRTGLDLGKVEW